MIYSKAICVSLRLFTLSYKKYKSNYNELNVDILYTFKLITTFVFTPLKIRYRVKAVIKI